MKSTMRTSLQLGRVSTIKAEGAEVHVLRSDEFESCVRERGAVRIENGRDFRFATYEEGGSRTLLIGSHTPPNKDEINQDFAYRRRRAVADVVERQFPRLERKFVRVEVASAVQIASCVEAFEAGSEEDVMTACTVNTQRLFDGEVDRLTTQAPDDPWEGVTTNVNNEGYSHIKYFARIYYVQVRLIGEMILAHGEHPLTVLVLGCGRGHDVATIGNQMVKRDLAHRLSFAGIDESETDLAVARGLLAGLPSIHAEFIADNLCARDFDGRLRRLRADVVLANHVLEHLPAEDEAPDCPAGQRLEVLKNRYLHPWLFASGKALSVSVPVNDPSETTISDHRRVFTGSDVEHLGQSMPLRCALAVTAYGLENAAKSGLISWVRERERSTLGATFLRIRSRSQYRDGEEVLGSDFVEPFNPAKFAEARTAPKVADIQDRAAFTARGSFPHQARQVLIKMPGTEVRLPSEFAQCAEAVQLMVDHNRRVNPRYEDSYGYFNVFRALTTFSKYRGLSLLPHGDQLQTLHAGYAYPPDWSYIVSSCIPTLLFDGQTFDVSGAVERAGRGEKVNLYDTFREQLKLDLARKSENFGILLLSPYLVHSASEAEDSVFRIFLKVAFSSKRFFDNRELRRNLAFDYGDWFLKDVLTFRSGFLHHAHWNEEYVAQDVMKGQSRS